MSSTLIIYKHVIISFVISMLVINKIVCHNNAGIKGTFQQGCIQDLNAYVVFCTMWKFQLLL